ncbi:MAG: HD domain-containing protein [Acetobacteraceae bacterium]
MPRIAQRLAERYHAGQTDQRGVAYNEHLAAVAALLRQRWPDATPEEIAAAWLHDVLEDATGATAEALLGEGVTPRTIEIIRALTRPEGKPYDAYIREIAAAGDVSVLRVKISDNAHNSDPARSIPGSDLVARRYAPARAVLEAGLDRATAGRGG